LADRPTALRREAVEPSAISACRCAAAAARSRAASTHARRSGSVGVTARAVLCARDHDDWCCCSARSRRSARRHAWRSLRQSLDSGPPIASSARSQVSASASSPSSAAWSDQSSVRATPCSCLTRARLIMSLRGAIRAAPASGPRPRMPNSLVLRVRCRAPRLGRLATERRPAPDGSGDTHRRPPTEASQAPLICTPDSAHGLAPPSHPLQPLVNDKLRAPDIAAGNTPDEPDADSNPLIAPEQMNECGHL
jgi:hypothetical protein